MDEPVDENRKLTAEERIARFDPATMNSRMRDVLSGIVSEAATILPFTLLSPARLRGIVNALRLIDRLEGDTAEIGCNAGGTSRLIALLNRGRRHWACDTFTGLVDVGSNDTSESIVNGAFSNRLSTLESVAARLSDLNVRVVPGYFPGNAPAEMLAARYSLAHIDVDTYRSIHACFEFFAERMSRGGIIVMDDVIGCGTEGGKQAWEEIIAAGSARFDIIDQNDPQVIVRFN